VWEGLGKVVCLFASVIEFWAKNLWFEGEVEVFGNFVGG
jgi:hypothetical protein